MTCKRIRGKTPSDGDYSEIYYFNDAGEPVDEAIATQCVIRECKTDETLLSEVHGKCN